MSRFEPDVDRIQISFHAPTADISGGRANVATNTITISVTHPSTILMSNPFALCVMRNVIVPRRCRPIAFAGMNSRQEIPSENQMELADARRVGDNMIEDVGMPLIGGNIGPDKG